MFTGTYRSKLSFVCCFCVAAIASSLWFSGSSGSAWGAPQRGAKKYDTLKFDADFDVPPPSPDFTVAEMKDYKSKYKKNASNQKLGEKELKASLGSGSLNANAKKYLNGYLFPAMTQTDASSISRFGEMRTEFLKTFLDDRVVGPAREELIGLTMTSMESIAANPRLHPAARLNAVYLIGQMDDVAPVRGGSPPVPASAAMPALVKIFTANDNQKYPQFLQIAALAGIQRHFEILGKAGRPVDPANSNPILLRINDTLGKPIDQQNQAVSYWLKRRSAQIGGFIGNEQTLTHLMSILNGKNEPFWLQMDALDAMDAMVRRQQVTQNSKEVATTVTTFVVNGLKGEADRIKQARDKLVYDNILFRDVDYVESGTNFETATGAETGEGASRGSGGAGGKFGGTGMGAGMGAGMGGPGGPGGPGGGLVTADPGAPRVELPNYELQTIRSRIKSIAFKARKVLGQTDDSGLRKILAADTKSTIENVVFYLDQVISDSTIGVIDREDRNRDPEDDVPTTSYTKQLIEGCMQWSTDIGESLAELKPAPAAGADN